MNVDAYLERIGANRSTGLGDLHPPGEPGETAAIREHNRLVAEDDRYVGSIVPIRDGVMAALRVA
ncbi:hypothetical protein ACIA5D_49250 [Actinoplanes sp. NPDC051513]|uniref:hypothetical protein n=1 Tax=Actinoplanes sp. NPDC051513 TaxID=3363908 RepID=UPI00379CD14E